MSAAEVASDVPQYPLRFDVEYPEQLNRWLPLVKWLLAIPHLLILYALINVSYVLQLIAFFAILFTRKFPQSLFEFVVNIYRWQMNVSAYTGLMRDEYPPFSWEPGQYPVTFEIDYREQLNRWLPLIKWILAFPHYVVLFALFIAAGVVWIIALFAILFTTRFPHGLFDFNVGVFRWWQRVNAYVYFMRDEYPPFSLK
jgi:Domain of unknown function (DUF4389)